MKSPVPGNNSEWCFPPHLLFHTHTGTPFVKQLTNGTHGLKDTVGREVKSLIFERPANKLQRLLNAQAMSKCLYCRSSFIDTSGKTQQTTGTEVLIAQIIAELNLFQLIQLIHFDDCIQCDCRSSKH